MGIITRISADCNPGSWAGVAYSRGAPSPLGFCFALDPKPLNSEAVWLTGRLCCKTLEAPWVHKSGVASH